MASAFDKLVQLRKSLDRDDMFGRVATFPAQMDDAWQRSGQFVAAVSRATPARVVLCGMGGSAIGGDLACSFLGNRLNVTVHVNRGYEIPQCLTQGTFFVFSSHSGNTAETIASYRQVRAQGLNAVAITSGGTLADLCSEDGVPVCAIPGGMQPRAAIGYSFLSFVRILDAIGAADVDDKEFVEARAAVENACRIYAADDAGNLASELAYQIEGKLPVIYSCDALLGAVARRWGTQLNENSKSLAHVSAFTELNHNEIVGWDTLPAIRKQMLVMYLHDVDDHPQVSRQADIALETIKPFCADVVRISGGEGGRLARLLSTMILGDFTSVYLSYLNGVDPTPVAKIMTLKERLQNDTV